MNKIRCLIIEDEKPARGVLKKHIADIPILELVGAYSDAPSSMDQLQSETVDLLFLDINLPKISGINFLKSLSNPPDVIITTAYPDYALEGFELNVVDYLLKPISFERLMEAVNKVKRTGHPEAARSGENTQEGFTFEKADNTVYKIRYSDIRYIESDGDYVRVYTRNQTYMFRQSLKYWESILPEQTFVRVHKSYILNISGIDQITGNRVVMEDTVIPIGRTYKENFWTMIRNTS